MLNFRLYLDDIGEKNGKQFILRWLLELKIEISLTTFWKSVVRLWQVRQKSQWQHLINTAERNQTFVTRSLGRVLEPFHQATHSFLGIQIM